MSFQQKLILILFIISLVLLTANILVGKVFKTENTIILPRSLSVQEIDSLFTQAANNFGLPSSALRKQKIRDVKIDEDYPSYSLSIPKDLPIPVFISELNEIFSSYAVEILSDEKTTSGRTILRINSEDELRLASVIDYNPNLNREASTVGFLISINDKTNKTAIDDLLNTPEPFGFLFTPSLLMKSFISSNQNQNRQFALLLGDDISDLDYKMESNYSERRLKSSIRNLLGAFEKAAFFVIDDNSSFYSSKIFPFVEKEFLARKIKLIKRSELNFISGTVSSSSDQFRELLLNMDSRSSAVIVCTPEDFSNILNDIRGLRKIGYKYLIPSDVLALK